MQIEDLKRWHWIAIGIVVGLAFAYVWAGIEPPSVRNTSTAEFLRDVTLKDPQSGRPIVQNIVVQPPQPNFEADELKRRIQRHEAEARAAEQDGKQEEAQAARALAETARQHLARSQVNVVTYRKWMKQRNGDQRVLVQRQLIAEIPFAPSGRRGADVDPSYTIASHLREMHKQHPHITFNSGWWTSKPATYAIWTLGSVIVIGGVWPMLLNAVIGAGYGRPRETKKNEYDLSRFKGAPEPASAPAKAKVSEEEHQRLRAMTDQLESKLGGFGQVGTQPQATEPVSDESPIRKLDGGPLELRSMESNSNAEDEIEIKGEYYPVLIHHKKQINDDPPEG